MSRSSTTGIYTRVDNSFSNPIVGTTISPTDADTFFDDVESCMNSFIATSTTSLAIGTGSKTFTVASDVANKVFLASTNIHAFSLSNPANYMDCTVTSYNNGTGALVTTCVATGGSGTITDWVIITSGAQGITGATGATGERAGFKYTFNSATSGDPGSGKFLFNNATFASATSLNISETDGESIALSSLLATLDDSTNTNKCLLVWINSDGSKGFIGYLTGTLTDNGTYDTFSLTPVTSWGSPANNDVFRMQPLRIGDKGADGAISISGTPSAGQFGIWTGASTQKGVSITGIVKGNGASDPAAATAGTDYVKPDTATAFTKHQYFTLSTLTDGANISWDASAGQKAKVTLGGNRTMNATSNAVEGATYFLWVIQDGTGSRTLSWTTTGSGSFDFGTSGAPTLTTTASKADLLTFDAISIGGTLKLRYTGIARGFA